MPMKVRDVMGGSQTERRNFGRRCALVLAGFLACPPLLQPAHAASLSFSDTCNAARNKAVIPACLDAAKQFESGKIGLARTLMLQVMDDAPKEGRLRVLLGLVLLRGDYAPSAERELRQARNDGAPDQMVVAPLLRAMLARHEEDLLLLEFPAPAANASGEVAAQILYGRAQALKSQDRMDDAAAELDRSLSLQKTPVGLLDRADIALAQNDAILAGKRIDEALALDPRNVTALTAKLKLLVRAGDAAKALAFSDQVLKLFPGNVDVRGERIKLFLRLNQDAKAAAEVQAIQARSRNDPLGQFYQAILIYRANDKAHALLLMQGLSTGFVKQHPELALQMAQVALDNGKSDTATALLASALSAAPDMIDVRLRLAQLRMDQESPQGALVVLGPVKDSPDPRVQQLMAKVNKAIARNRAF